MKKKALFLSILLSAYLGIHNGRIALFCGNHPDPREIYPVSVRTLPPEEQQALAAGVEIQNNLHLAQLLENYLS